MQNCNQMHACYLFQQDKHYDLSYDTGDKALQCGRHVDIFKLWLMWRAKVRFLFFTFEAILVYGKSNFWQFIVVFFVFFFFWRLCVSLFQGTIGFEAQIDKCLELSEYLYNKIKDREGYEMVFDGKVRR